MPNDPIHDMTGQNRSVNQLQQDFADRFKSGGGGGSNGGMEPRIARLEAHLEHVQSTMVELKGRVGNVETVLSDVRVNQARLEERVSHLPSKGFIVASSATIMTLVAALSIFGDNLKALIGL